jgi:hypothetical protein
MFSGDFGNLWPPSYSKLPWRHGSSASCRGTPERTCMLFLGHDWGHGISPISEYRSRRYRCYFRSSRPCPGEWRHKVREYHASETATHPTELRHRDSRLLITNENACKGDTRSDFLGVAEVYLCVNASRAIHGLVQRVRRVGGQNGNVTFSRSGSVQGI